MSPKFLFKKALNLKLSTKFLFKNFFFKILKELTKNDHKSLNYIQIHNLGHFLDKNILWLNLVLVLLLKWSIVHWLHQFEIPNALPDYYLLPWTPYCMPKIPLPLPVFYLPTTSYLSTPLAYLGHTTGMIIHLKKHIGLLVYEVKCAL